MWAEMVRAAGKALMGTVNRATGLDGHSEYYINKYLILYMTCTQTHKSPTILSIFLTVKKK